MMKILKSNKGSALLVALLLTGMLSLIALMAIDTSNTDMELAYNQTHLNAAFYNAEAGAKRAFVAINNNNDWRTGYNGQSFGDGTFSVTLVDSNAVMGLFDTVVIRSVGNVQAAEAAVEVWTTPEYLYPFQWAMFGKSWINLDQTTCTDSYNSDSGSYATTLLADEGDLGTNGSITGSKQVDIGGDAKTAIGGSITLGAGSHIAGDSTTTMDSVQIPDVPQEEFDYAEANNTAPLGLSGSGWSYNNGSNALSMGSYSTVTLTSGVYYFSEINMGQQSQIVLAPGADVKIYVTGDINFNQGSTINDGGVPRQLQIYSSGGSLNFNQDNSFYGSFYGPNAHIQYDQTTNVYGSLVGNTIKLDKGACFHYDRDLANVKYQTSGNMLQVAWKEL